MQHTCLLILRRLFVREQALQQGRQAARCLLRRLSAAQARRARQRSVRPHSQRRGRGSQQRRQCLCACWVGHPYGDRCCTVLQGGLQGGPLSWAAAAAEGSRVVERQPEGGILPGQPLGCVLQRLPPAGLLAKDAKGAGLLQRRYHCQVDAARLRR